MASCGWANCISKDVVYGVLWVGKVHIKGCGIWRLVGGQSAYQRMWYMAFCGWAKCISKDVVYGVLWVGKVHIKGCGIWRLVGR